MDRLVHFQAFALSTTIISRTNPPQKHSMGSTEMKTESYLRSSIFESFGQCCGSGPSARRLTGTSNAFFSQIAKLESARAITGDTLGKNLGIRAPCFNQINADTRYNGSNFAKFLKFYATDQPARLAQEKKIREAKLRACWLNHLMMRFVKLRWFKVDFHFRANTNNMSFSPSWAARTGMRDMISGEHSWDMLAQARCTSGDTAGKSLTVSCQFVQLWRVPED